MMYSQINYQAFLAYCNTTESARLTLDEETLSKILDSHMEGNYRNLKPGNLKQALHRLESGTYDGRITAIHVGQDGNIQNGNHRLTQALKFVRETPGATVDFTFEFGMPDEAVDYYDTQSSGRTAADYIGQTLELHMPSAASAYISAARFLGYGASNVTTPSYLRQIDGVSPTLKDSVTRAHEACKDAEVAWKRSWYLITSTILFEVGHDRETIIEFLELHSEGSKRGPSGYHLVNTIQNISAGQNGNEKAVKYILHAFNKWKRDEPINRGISIKVEDFNVNKVIKPRGAAA